MSVNYVQTFRHFLTGHKVRLDIGGSSRAREDLSASAGIQSPVSLRQAAHSKGRQLLTGPRDVTRQNT